MSTRKRHAARLASDARGLAALAVDGVVGVTGIVERMHATIASIPAPIGPPHARPARGIAGMVYRSVRGVARGVGWSLDRALAPLADALGPASAPLQRAHVVAALNGVLGDRLAATGNPLAIPMALRPATGAEVPRARIALFLHGLCMHDRQWPRGAGSAEAAVRALGYTPLYLHYNSGRAIADNGRDLSAQLDALLATWPTPPVELALVCHSMGGLVARSACEHARLADAPWLDRLRHLVFLGTPHRGAVLERAGKRVDGLLRLSPYTAPFVALGGTRSAGIQDLGHGRVTADGSPAALPAGVACHAIAGSLRRGGDGLVSVASALAQRGPGLGPMDTVVIRNAGHLALLDHGEVVVALKRWLA